MQKVIVPSQFTINFSKHFATSLVIGSMPDGRERIGSVHVLASPGINHSAIDSCLWFRDLQSAPEFEGSMIQYDPMILVI